jgi:hypothetical protein
MSYPGDINHRFSEHIKLYLDIVATDPLKAEILDTILKGIYDQYPGALRITPYLNTRKSYKQIGSELGISASRVGQLVNKFNSRIKFLITHLERNGWQEANMYKFYANKTSQDNQE